MFVIESTLKVKEYGEGVKGFTCKKRLHKAFMQMVRDNNLFRWAVVDRPGHYDYYYIEDGSCLELDMYLYQVQAVKRCVKLHGCFKALDVE